MKAGILCATKNNREGSNLPKTCLDFTSWLNIMLWLLCFWVGNTIMKKVSLLLNSIITSPQQEVDHLACSVKKEKDGTERTIPVAFTFEYESSFASFKNKFAMVCWLFICLYCKLNVWIELIAMYSQCWKLKLTQEREHPSEFFPWLVCKKWQAVIGYNSEFVQTVHMWFMIWRMHLTLSLKAFFDGVAPRVQVPLLVLVPFVRGCSVPVWSK